MDFKDAEAYRMLGLGHYANEEYPAALNAFQESLARDPGNADVYYEMGLAEQELDSDQAVAYFRKALQLNSQMWQAHSSLGSLLAQQSHFAEAIAELSIAKQLAPNEPSIRENLANAYYGKGDYDVAIAEYNELFKTNPGWRRGHDSLARAYMAKNEYASAIAELRLAVAQNPSNPGEHRALGQLLLLSGQQQEAVRELRIAVELDPDYCVLALLLGHRPAATAAASFGVEGISGGRPH